MSFWLLKQYSNEVFENGKIISRIKSRDGIIRSIKVNVLSQGKLLEIQIPLQGLVSLEVTAPVAEKGCIPEGEKKINRP